MNVLQRHQRSTLFISAKKGASLHVSVLFPVSSSSPDHMASPNERCTCTSFLFCLSKKKRKSNSFLCGEANSSSTAADLELLVSAEWIRVKQSMLMNLTLSVCHLKHRGIMSWAQTHTNRNYTNFYAHTFCKLPLSFHHNLWLRWHTFWVEIISFCHQNLVHSFIWNDSGL